MQIYTDSAIYRILQSNLSSSTSTLNELYVKTSTGLEVSKASDDPSAVQTIVSCNSEITQTERYVENCNNVDESLSNTETYVDTIVDLFARAREIAIAGANDSLSTEDRETLAQEVEQLQDELLDIANTQVNGVYIFAGYNDDTEPFSGSPVTYNGTSDHKMIEISSSSTVAKNVTGDELFMSPVNLFTTLEDLETALLSDDASTISSQIDAIGDAEEQVSTVLSTIGNTMNRVEDVSSMHSDALLILEETLSENQDADLTEVLSDLAAMEVTLEAVMEVTSRVSSLSLMDYI